MELIDQWKIQDSLDVYESSTGARDISASTKQRTRHVHPSKRSEQAIDLKDLIDQLQDRGIQLPILLRFTDILRHRVGEIHEASRTHQRIQLRRQLRVRVSDQGQPAATRR